MSLIKEITDVDDPIIVDIVKRQLEAGKPVWHRQWYRKEELLPVTDIEVIEGDEDIGEKRAVKLTYETRDGIERATAFEIPKMSAKMSLKKIPQGLEILYDDSFDQDA
jgi:hypothetical protein